MDLLFLPNYGHPFSIEAGYFDTVLEVKKKIQKYQGIPVSKQTLIFNGKTLTDDLLCCMEILDCSRINLLISPDADPPPPPPPPPPTPPSTTHEYHPNEPIHNLAMDLLFQPSHGNPFSMEVGYFNTVLQIKMNIQKHQGIPVSKQTLFLNGNTLPDDLIVLYSEIIDCSTINLLLSPDEDAPPPPSTTIQPPPPSTTIQPPPPSTTIQPPPPFTTIQPPPYFTTIQPPPSFTTIQPPPPFTTIQPPPTFTAIQPPPSFTTIQPPPPFTTIQPPPSSTKIQLLLKGPPSKPGKALEADIHDTIKRLKEKIQETEGVHASRIFMHVNGVELQDLKTVQDCGLSDNSEINVGVRPVRPARPVRPVRPSSSSRQSSSKMVKVFVLPHRGKEKVPVEVSPSDIVSGLREKIEKMGLDLPKEYFFIHKQSVMEDDLSFQWHEVRQGDTIDIFPGRVTRADPK